MACVVAAEAAWHAWWQRRPHGIHGGSGGRTAYMVVGIAVSWEAYAIICKGGYAIIWDTVYAIIWEGVYAIIWEGVYAII